MREPMDRWTYRVWSDGRECRGDSPVDNAARPDGVAGRNVTVDCP